MESQKKYLIDKMQQNNIKLNTIQVEQLYHYYKLLIETNKVMNLTAITKYEEVVVKHFIDSIVIKDIINLSDIKTVIDIGTGAGFPGIPLKIVFPELKITLMDSLNKRIKFLKNVIDELELNEIEVIHSRAEDLAKKKDYREQFDLAVSRAVANLSTLSEYCIPFVKKGGVFISYKAKDVDEEIKHAEKAIKLLGGEVKKYEQIFIPMSNEQNVVISEDSLTQDQDTQIERNLIIIKKLKLTPQKFPRKAGTPSTNPL